MNMKSYFKVHDVFNRDIHSCDVNDDVFTAINIMIKNNIGSIFVKDNHQFKGIITERGLLKRIVNINKNPNTLGVKEIMTQDIIEINQNESLITAALLMSKKSVKVLVIIEDEEIIGVISLSDIMKILPDSIELLFEEARMEGLKSESSKSSHGYCEICGIYDEYLFSNDKYICEECYSNMEDTHKILNDD